MRRRLSALERRIEELETQAEQLKLDLEQLLGTLHKSDLFQLGHDLRDIL